MNEEEEFGIFKEDAINNETAADDGDEENNIETEPMHLFKGIRDNITNKKMFFHYIDLIIFVSFLVHFL